MSGKRDCSCARVKHRHGTARAYDSDRCRCLPCALANSRRKAAWEAGSDDRFTTPHITGTRRRLQALTLLGWSTTELAAATGLNHQVILRLRNTGSMEHVLWSTHEAVAAVYDELWDTPSTGPHRRRMANLAANRGWLPPLAYDDDLIDDPAAQPTASPGTDTGIDEVAVAQAMGGRRVTLTKAERVEAVRQLTDAGYSKSQIVERLGTYWRQVERDRAEGRAA